MKDIYYKSSEGVIINLIQKPYKMLDDTDLFNWEWDYETAGSNYPYITAFKKQMVSKQFNLVISGSSETDMLNNIEHFVEVVDRDVRLNQAGKLYYGNYYRECFITGHTKGKFLKKNISTHGFTIVAENGDWKHEETSVYEGLSGGVYLNSNAMPSVSSNETNYSYDVCADTEGILPVTSTDRNLIVGMAQTLHIEEITGVIQYLTTGSYVTVQPNDCPIDIDISSMKPNDAIHIKTPVSPLTSFVTYSLLGDEDLTYIDWQTDYVSEYVGDFHSYFMIDLGFPIEIKYIKGLDVGCVVENLSSAEIILQTSFDGENWTNVESVSMPLSRFNYVTLEKEWTSNYPTVRYIRIVGNEYGSDTPRRTRPFKILTNKFQVRANGDIPARNIINDNYIDCDAIITIYGPTSNPIVTIGENEYGAVNTTLDDGEKLEINTRDETVQKFTDDTWLNIYANRTDESFNKIPIGTSEILWNGNLKVEIEKLLTRSDPKWN